MFVVDNLAMLMMSQPGPGMFIKSITRAGVSNSGCKGPVIDFC